MTPELEKKLRFLADSERADANLHGSKIPAFVEELEDLLGLDHRALLKKYMAEVMDLEGVDYLSRLRSELGAGPEGDSLSVSPEELAELEAIAAELREEFFTHPDSGSSP